MRDQPIVITEPDARLLRSLLAAPAYMRHDHEHLDELRVELERAQVLGIDEIPHDVVTMHRKLRVRDLHSGEHQELTLVSPVKANVAARRISILAPLGTALLGYRQGDEVEWHMPGGLRRLRIEHVASVEQTEQPEAVHQ